MPDEEKKITVVIPVEFSRDRVIVNENAVYGAPILPQSPQNLNWRIEVHKNAMLKSDVFGKSIYVDDNCKIMGTVFGDIELSIGNGCEIGSDLLGRGKITIGNGCSVNGNIIGKEIWLGEGCNVKGNVIGDTVNVGKNTVIGGMIISLRGECSVGDHVKARDVISHGRLHIGKGVEIEDDVIWSHEKIVSKKVLLEGKEPNPLHIREFQGKEINLNTDRMTPKLKRYECNTKTLELLKRIITI